MRQRVPVRAIRRAVLITALLPAALGLAACGNKEENPTTADTEGLYVRAGKLSYQVQVSRQLNQFNIEDHGYLAAVSTPPPTPSQMWFGVFVRAKNETHSNQTTTDSFDIVDAVGNRYYPARINSSRNPYAWVRQTLQPLQTEPLPDSTASYGPTQGGELLFKLDNSIYSNRPLTLEIHAPGQAKPTSISLDL